MLDIDYLLKLYKDGLLNSQFLFELKSYLMKKNQNAQEILNYLAIQQKKTFEYMTQILNIAKQQVDEDCQKILYRVKAAEYIKIYKKPFLIVTVETNGDYEITIKFPDELKEEEASSPNLSKKLKKQKEANIPVRISEFIKDILMFSEFKDLISTGNDEKKIGIVYRTYMEKLHTQLINDDSFFTELNHEDREKVYNEVETHIALQLYSHAFPKAPSKQDKKFNQKMLLLQWLDPTTLGIKKEDLKVDYWKTACFGIFMPI